LPDSFVIIAAVNATKTRGAAFFYPQAAVLAYPQFFVLSVTLFFWGAVIFLYVILRNCPYAVHSFH